jgi:hypothetical protein
LEETKIYYEPLSQANYGLLATLNASMKIAHLVGEGHCQLLSHEIREQVYSLMNQMEDLAGIEFVDHSKATKDWNQLCAIEQRARSNTQENFRSWGRNAKHVPQSRCGLVKSGE